MHEEHWVSLLESELNDIETIVYADLRKLVSEGKKKHAIESGATWFIKEIEKILDGGK